MLRIRKERVYPRLIVQTITGDVNSVLFYREDSGYTIARLTSDDLTQTSIVGCMPRGIKGNRIIATGNWTTNPKYGKQFKVESCRIEKPSGTIGLINYLSKNIPGIGPTTAKRIVDMFGETTLDVLNETPEKLVQVKGITKKKVDAIRENVSSTRNEQEIIVSIQNYGLTFNEAVKIFGKYKMNSMNILEHFPYRMIADIKGFGFLKVDEMAQKAGIPFDSIERVDAGILFNLSECFQTGNMYLDKDELMEKSRGILGLEDEIIQTRIEALCSAENIIMDTCSKGACYYLPVLYLAETGIARMIAQLAATDFSDQATDAEIAKYEATLPFKLDDSQRNALKNCIKCGVTVITGGPGTGKTTIMRGVCSLLARKKATFVLAAPTGRAAKRMSEATGYPASTIHKLLKFAYDKKIGKAGFTVNAENPLDVDAVLLDEASMIDAQLMYNLLLALKSGTKLYLIGDVNQLPSVGPGMVLSELIDSGMIEVICLEQIHRQDSGSQICVNADLVNRGEKPVMKGADCLFVKTEDTEGTKGKVLAVVNKYLASRVPMDAVQVLSAMKRGPAGCDSLNEGMQQLVNPPEDGKKEYQVGARILRTGDRVLQTKNNYDIEWIGTRNGESGKGIFNGDLGTITDIDEKNKNLKVRFFDDKIAVYTFSQAGDFILAYAMTVHKSQGAEFPVVIIPVYGAAPSFANRKLLYTAITRAKKKLILVGQPKALYLMLQSEDFAKRNTLLCAKLKKEILASDEVPF